MMNEEYIKRLDFDSDTFEAMKTDMNFILQRMIGSMIEKDSTEGSMTIKIDVNMVTEWSQATITVMMTQRRNSQCLECQVT